MENRHRLGRAGESLAKKLLERAGFTDIEPLRTGYRWADFTARRNTDPVSGRPTRHFSWDDGGADTTLHIISVKARNKWEKGGALNSRYLLGTDCKRKMMEAIVDNDVAIPGFLVLAVEPETLDCYFGYMETLRRAGLNCKGIPMSAGAPQHYGYQTLAIAEKHGLDYAALTNLTEDSDTSPDAVQVGREMVEPPTPHTRRESPRAVSYDAGLGHIQGLTPTQFNAYSVLVEAAPRALQMHELKALMKKRGNDARSYYEAFNKLVSSGLAEVVMLDESRAYRLRNGND